MFDISSAELPLVSCRCRAFLGTMSSSYFSGKQAEVKSLSQRIKSLILAPRCQQTIAQVVDRAKTMLLAFFIVQKKEKKFNVVSI